MRHLLPICLAVVIASGPACGGDDASFSPSYLTPPAVCADFREAGLACLPAEQVLSAWGASETAASEGLALYFRGRPYPFALRAAAQGPLAKGDTILLYVPPNDSPFIPRLAFWMRGGSEEGLRLPELDGTPGTGPPVRVAPTTLHLEEQAQYWPMLPNGAGKDHWFAARVGYGKPYRTKFTVHPGEGEDPIRVRVRLHGLSYLPQAPDHHAVVKINGTSVLDHKWDGQTPAIVATEAPATVLREGENELAVELVNDLNVKFDFSFLDWVKIQYRTKLDARENQLEFEAPQAERRTYRVEGFSSAEIEVLRLDARGGAGHVSGTRCEQVGDKWAVTFAGAGGEGVRYLVAAEPAWVRPVEVRATTGIKLRERKEPVDYLVIAPPEFQEPLQPLVDYRTKQGYRLEVVTPRQIYDEFAYGHKTPEAIRAFLSYCYHEYPPPRCRFVLLVGDASSDYRHWKPNSLPDILPTAMAQTSPWGDTGSDSWFGDVEGDDWAPEFALGRVPARRPEQVATFVAKTLRREQENPGGTWERSAFLVADNDEAKFAQICDEAAEALGPTWQITKAYMAQASDAARVRRELLAGFNAGPGVLLYVGHAQPTQWAHEGIFNLQQAGAVTNGERTPFLIALTCLDGYFQSPLLERCLAEELLFLPDGGSVAQWSPTGMSYSHAHEAMLKRLLELRATGRFETIGEAIQAMWQSLLAQGGRADIGDAAKMYIFFGDPALRLEALLPRG